MALALQVGATFLNMLPPYNFDSDGKILKS